MATLYETIIFLQGDGYTEAMTETGGETDGYIVHQSAETWDALFEYLKQWDYGDPTDDTSGTPPWGTSDDTDDSHAGYVVTWNASYGYCSLTRVFESDDAS